MKKSLSWLVLALFAVLAVLPGMPGKAEAGGGGKVYVLRIDKLQVIDQGLANITKRAFEQAAADPATQAVAIVVDTPGGYTDAALRMKETILTSKIKSVAYVTDLAASSGALIVTAAEKMYMAPGAVVGAAEVRNASTNQMADYKTMATWIGAFRSAAEARGRDPNLAQAMVDKTAKVPDQKGELLVLTAKDAVDKRYADGMADSLDDALAKAGLANYEKVEIQPTMSDAVGRFLTQPWVAILLLVAGVIAIGIEFIKPGVTLPGLIGVVCLSLFFFGNMLVGSAGWLEVGLALLGILLLLIEAFIPGFGVFGVGGIIAMGSSIFLSVPSQQQAFQYLAWTAVAFMLALFGIISGLSRRGLGKTLTLARHEKGWVPARADLSHMLGQEGKALTVLRPAGTAQFGQDKVDVVTEGEFVSAGTKVKVIRVDGARVIVRSVE
ncbi:MAG TPA: NfeD family protein [Symbiobacteriaceae bacterium]|nr:NfeD family protein [Symbiobacteriaceae bacterium]